MRKRKPVYDSKGLPIDVHDWTEEDWKDLHEAMEQAIERISQRHARRRFVEAGGSPYCNWSGE